MLPLGPYLGELTDELSDGGSGEEDDHSTEFVSGGPKPYALAQKRVRLRLSVKV